MNVKDVLLVIQSWLGWWVFNPMKDLRKLREVRESLREGNQILIASHKDRVDMLENEAQKRRQCGL